MKHAMLGLLTSEEAKVLDSLKEIIKARPLLIANPTKEQMEASSAYWKAAFSEAARMLPVKYDMTPISTEGAKIAAIIELCCDLCSAQSNGDLREITTLTKENLLKTLNVLIGNGTITPVCEASIIVADAMQCSEVHQEAIIQRSGMARAQIDKVLGGISTLLHECLQYDDDHPENKNGILRRLTEIRGLLPAEPAITNSLTEVLSSWCVDLSDKAEEIFLLSLPENPAIDFVKTVDGKTVDGITVDRTEDT